MGRGRGEGGRGRWQGRGGRWEGGRWEGGGGGRGGMGGVEEGGVGEWGVHTHRVKNLFCSTLAPRLLRSKKTWLASGCVSVNKVDITS